MRTKVIILGTGGNCLDILDTIRDLADAGTGLEYECAGFLDDDQSRWGTRPGGVEVLGPLSSASAHDDCVFVNGIGSPATFRRKQAIIAGTGIPSDRFATIVHPTASVSRTALLGRGTVVFQHVTITTGVRIGDHVVILPQSVVSHDCTIGDYSCLAGGVRLSGDVHVAPSCYVGTGALVRGGVRLGEGSLIGMGAVVLTDVEGLTTVIGNPAKVRPARSTSP